MFTGRSVLLGLLSVVGLFLLTMLYRAFSHGKGVATGRGVLYLDLSTVITSPVFWTFATVIFLATALLGSGTS